MCLFKEYMEGDATKGVLLRSMEELSGPPMPRINGTCALVGSSGVLLMHDHGEAIDNASKVFRFNTAPVVGSEKFVGARDDFRFVNEKVLDFWAHSMNLSMLTGEISYTASCTLCNLGTDERVSPDLFMRRVLGTTVAHPQVTLYSSDLTLEYNVQEFIKRIYSLDESPAGVTTGAVGMAMALSLCDEVKAYGMATSPYDAVLPYHYWEPHSTSAPTEIHHASFIAEKDLWTRLATNEPAEVGETGVVVIPGFSRLSCPSHDE